MFISIIDILEEEINMYIRSEDSIRFINKDK
jgi:hypothetical protein